MLLVTSVCSLQRRALVTDRSSLSQNVTMTQRNLIMSVYEVLYKTVYKSQDPVLALYWFNRGLFCIACKNLTLKRKLMHLLASVFRLLMCPLMRAGRKGRNLFCGTFCRDTTFGAFSCFPNQLQAPSTKLTYTAHKIIPHLDAIVTSGHAHVRIYQCENCLCPCSPVCVLLGLHTIGSICVRMPAAANSDL